MSGAVFAMAALAIAAILAIGIAEVGTAAVCASQSQTAADAAALAGAAAGTDAAQQAAIRNDSALISLEQSGDIFTATVRGCANTAIAHAERRETAVINQPLD